MRISVILYNIALGVMCLLWKPLFVFELRVFCGGFGKRTRRQATPLSNPKRRRLQQMAWNQARRTSSRSEPGQLLATGASAEDLSLKPAQCVSPSNYCQTVSLEPLPETSRDRYLRGKLFLFTLETLGTSWPCTKHLSDTFVVASLAHVEGR